MEYTKNVSCPTNKTTFCILDSSNHLLIFCSKHVVQPKNPRLWFTLLKILGILFLGEFCLRLATRELGFFQNTYLKMDELDQCPWRQMAGS